MTMDEEKKSSWLVCMTRVIINRINTNISFKIFTLGIFVILLSICNMMKRIKVNTTKMGKYCCESYNFIGNNKCLLNIDYKTQYSTSDYPT